jgi:hypothetical protein
MSCALVELAYATVSAQTAAEARRRYAGFIRAFYVEAPGVSIAASKDLA